IYASVKDENGLDIITGFMYACLMITSALAVVQRVLGVEADASLTDLELNEDMPGRVFSTLGNPNNFAEYLVLFMPFAFAFALNRKKEQGRAYYLAGMCLPLLAILLTYSRSGWIALAIAVAIFVALYDKRLIPVFIVVGILAIPFIPQNILNRILTIGNLEDTSSSYRVDIWTGCLDMLKDYWFTGVGLGTGGFAEIYPAYGVGESYVAPHSHMHFMEMLCELGILGFASYICMTFTLIKRSFAAASSKVPYKVRNVAIASAASMTGIVLIGCFEYCWFYPRVMFAFFVCAGVAMATYKSAKCKMQNAE
ncbi:MAG: O-antigen ligase family protein, partial [Clostridia bacterium]|nr:O-antigen ligase family protein [Clostridia bacterium]